MIEATTPGVETSGLTKYAWLSIAAAVVTITLKTGAYLLTGSVGLLSDAAESVVNLVAAVIALVALTVAARPADDNHHYGHGKAEYFRAGIEGLMIFVAAALIIVSAVDRLLHPQELESLGHRPRHHAARHRRQRRRRVAAHPGGQQHRSATLVADGKHLMTDVWTSVGVVVGVGLVAVTGWLPLDSLVAIAVAVNILWMGWRLVASSTTSLLDAALPRADVALVTEILTRHTSDEVHFHGLQTRESGRQRFVSASTCSSRGLDRAARARRRRAGRGRHPRGARAGERDHPPRAERGRALLRRLRATTAASRARRSASADVGSEQRVGQRRACLRDPRVRVADEREQLDQVVASPRCARRPTYDGRARASARTPRRRVRSAARRRPRATAPRPSRERRRPPRSARPGRHRRCGAAATPGRARPGVVVGGVGAQDVAVRRLGGVPVARLDGVVGDVVARVGLGLGRPRPPLRRRPDR